MDYLMNAVSDLLDKFASKVQIPVIPWNKMNEMMAVINPYLAKANLIFPVDTLLDIITIILGIVAVLLIVWGISFVRKMLPF